MFVLESASGRFSKAPACSSGAGKGAEPTSGVGRAEDVIDNEPERIVSELLPDESESLAARGGAC